MKVTCIGSGIFSLAIATNLKEKGNKVLIWTPNKEEIIEEKWKNFDLTTDITEALLFSEHLFYLVSSPYIKEMLNPLANIDASNKTIYIGTKGLLEEKPFYYSEYISQNFKVKNIAFFAGPNLAQDMILKIPTSITFSYYNKDTTNVIYEFFPRNIKVEKNEQMKEMELASVLKNVYAIGSGIVWETYQTKSSLISYLSHAYFELKQIVQPSTDMTGDFFLTGTMLESRNLTLGRIITRKENSEIFLENNTFKDALLFYYLLRRQLPQYLEYPLRIEQ